MIEVTPLIDTEGSFATYREAFGLDDDTPWVTAFHSYLARGPEWTVVVDTGVGPPGDDPFLPDRQALLPGALAAVAARPEDVDAVLLTHLHVDHVGWNMHAGEPFFPNARYVAHAADFDRFADRPERPYVRDQLLGLHAAGVLDLFDGDRTQPLPGVAVEWLPGHTPGHCSIVFDDGPVILGDLAAHELQLADPDHAFSSEDDPSKAAAARRRVLPALAEAGTLVGLTHLPHGLGRITRAGDGFAWAPLD